MKGDGWPWWGYLLLLPFTPVVIVFMGWCVSRTIGS